MTDTELKQLLAKMLPGMIRWSTHTDGDGLLWCGSLLEVLDTELLYICHLIEETLTGWNEQGKSQQNDYCFGELWDLCNQRTSGVAHATWQQRTIALAKVKGIEL